MVEFDPAELSVRRQCELLGLARSSCYYEAVLERESAEWMAQVAEAHRLDGRSHRVFGEWVEARLYADRVEIRYADKLGNTLPR